MFKKILFVITILICFIMGYGYWHVSTYGWLHISIRDTSGQEQKYKLIKNAEIVLRDLNGNVLAEGKSDNQIGVVYLFHPEFGSCVEVEKQAPFSKEARQEWYVCYEKKAKWIVKWARNVKFMNIKFDNCFLKKIPVSVSESKDDWWLWWIPLPHIGGKPSSYFNINVHVDGANCKVKPL
jgi:hypothetical protein